jgi:hypothetical protein
MTQPIPWSLATVEADGHPVACIESGEHLYRLEPSLARAGLPGMVSLMALFDDFARARTAISIPPMRSLPPAASLPCSTPAKSCAPAPIISIISPRWACPARRNPSSGCSSS